MRYETRELTKSLVHSDARARGGQCAKELQHQELRALKALDAKKRKKLRRSGAKRLRSSDARELKTLRR